MTVSTILRCTYARHRGFKSQSLFLPPERVSACLTMHQVRIYSLLLFSRFKFIQTKANTDENREWNLTAGCLLPARVNTTGVRLWKGGLPLTVRTALHARSTTLWDMSCEKSTVTVYLCGQVAEINMRKRIWLFCFSKINSN